MFFKRNGLDELLNDLKKRAEKDEKVKDLLKGVHRLLSKTAEEVMRPRVDVVMVSEDDTLMDLVAKFREHSYSKYPVRSSGVSEGADIVGVAYMKDVLYHLDKDLNRMKVSEIMRKPFFVPATQSCYNALKEMQKRRVSIGIVVDEYGSPIGIVTIEDLVEEIVGEIYEEHDKPESLYEELPDGGYLVNAQMPISELESLLEVDFGETESTSVGGFMIEKLGSMPEEGEVLRVDDVEFKAVEVSPQRILKVMVRKMGGER